MITRRQFYIDPEIQFPVILSLILLVTVEGFFLGWGFAQAISIARDWESQGQVLEFFKTVLLVVGSSVAVNFVIGTWISHKIAGPLVQLRRLMGEISRGNLEVEAVLRRGDLLHSHAKDFNDMVRTLRRLIYRDQVFAAESDEILSRLQGEVAKAAGLQPAARKELAKLLNEARSRLSIINNHFLKGRVEGQP